MLNPFGLSFFYWLSCQFRTFGLTHGIFHQALMDGPGGIALSNMPQMVMAAFICILRAMIRGLSGRSILVPQAIISSKCISGLIARIKHLNCIFDQILDQSSMGRPFH